MSEATDRSVIAVAMSGGADSTAALALLRKAGRDVFGITAVMTRERSRCCAPEDVESAAGAAAKLGVRHVTVEVQDAFETEVIGYFVSEYVAGRTPSPCVVCNRRIKFGALLEQALRLGADRIATGHYARVEPGDGGGTRLLRGIDRAKDQSYFLARLDAERLGRAVFPLGRLTKRQVPALLKEYGLERPARGESQDVCFVPDGDHGKWLDLRVLKTPAPGNIVTSGGRVVGGHRGIHHYTVGQRKGLGIATGSPMYVLRLVPDRNEVVVGSASEAESARICVGDLSWIAGAPPGMEFEAGVQIRYRHEPAPARITIRPGGRADVEFAEPQFGAAPGQSAAFYRGDEVLGAGWIEAGTAGNTG